MWLLGTRAHLFVFIRLEQHLQHCYSKMGVCVFALLHTKMFVRFVLCVCVLAPLFGGLCYFFPSNLGFIVKLLCVYMCEMPACSEYIAYWYVERDVSFIPEKDLCDRSRGDPSPLDWMFDQGTQGVCPVPCFSVSSPRLGRRFPAFSTFIVASHLKSNLNYGGQVGFFLYRPNGAFNQTPVVSWLWARGRLLHTSKPRKREK